MKVDFSKVRLASRYSPFINIGLGYIGAFYVSVKRSSEKRWRFRFTCSIVRAVNYSVVPPMKTSTCLFGIERFVSRRGVPSIIWPDNDRNFIASENELLNGKLDCNQQILTVNSVKNCIKLKFNPPSAPHHVRVSERQVRSFEDVFLANIGNTRLGDENMWTTFVLVEHCLNDCPQVPARADATDLDVFIPNHFLPVTADSSLPSNLSSDIDHRKHHARARLDYLESIIERVRPDFESTIQMVFSVSSRPENR